MPTHNPDSNAIKRSRQGKIKHIVPFALAWVIPVVLGLVLAFINFKQETASFLPEVPRETKIGSQVVDLSQTVAVKVKLGSSTSIKANRSGTITSWAVRTGENVSMGQRIFDINEIPIFAQVGGIPFYRDLKLGDEGNDVVSLHHLLCAESCPQGVSPDSSTFSSSTQLALEGFLRRHGINASSRAWSMKNTVYFPGSSAVLDTVLQEPGATVVEGDEVAKAVSGITEAQLVNPDDETPLVLGEAEMVLSAGDRAMQITQNISPTQLDELTTLLTGAKSEGTVTQQESRLDDTGILFHGLSLKAKQSNTYAVIPGTSLYLLDGSHGCIFLYDKGKVEVQLVEEYAKLPGKLNQIGIDSSFTDKIVLTDPFNDTRADLTKCVSK
ncbi:MAG: hypothetical protein SPK50_02115 [Mobiluncus porci]|uniref:hypothetical protein n=1 Tax=Mobiluncus porci TaxID=2652278 RepID=UPI0023F4053D|nr:hypothetical protein [Mobiluncus porci]MDD7542562.1 hypothetical protein [Mobiluncus porci]MDY5747914.1 hypothetical protein [Mobiluncus porci]